METPDLLGKLRELAKAGEKGRIAALIKVWDIVSPNQVDKSPRIGFQIAKEAAHLTDEETNFYAEVLIAFESLTDKRDTNYLKVLKLLTDFILSDVSRKDAMEHWKKMGVMP